MAGSRTGGPRIRLESSPSGGPYQELAVRFKSPSNTSVGSLASAPLSYTAVVGPYGASISVSSDEGERDAELNIVNQCKGHTPLDDMGIKMRNQPTIRLVSRCRGTPYGTQTGVILDDPDEDQDEVELSIDAPPGIRVIGRCTDSGSYSYRDEEMMIPPAIGRTGRCRDHMAAYVRSRGGAVTAGAKEYSGGSSERGVAAIAHVMGECTHFQEMSETEVSYEDDYETCKVCVKRMKETSRDGAAAQAPRITRKTSMVHIYAGDIDGDSPRDQLKQKRLCETKARYTAKRYPPSPPQTLSRSPSPPPSPPPLPPNRERKSRAPYKPPPASPPRRQPKSQTPPPSRTPSRPSSSPSPSRPSSRISSRAMSSSRSPSRAESRSPSMATTAKLEIEDTSWNSSQSSSIEVQLTKKPAKRREKESSRVKTTSRAREIPKKPVAPTPPPELRYSVEAKVAMSKDSLEMIKRASTEKVDASKSKPATSAEMVMRAAWQQYYSEYDKYKEEMAEWEDVQRKMRKQLARFMSGPSKPPAPPPGVQPTVASSKSALALPAPPEQASAGSNPQADEGMHIRIGLPGRMVKGRRSRSFSAGRPLEDAPPCVQAMYAHPGPFGPPGPFGSQPSFGNPPPPYGPPPMPFAGPGGPFRGVGFPRPPPMLMPPPQQQFGPPGPFAPQQPPLPFSGMRPLRRSTSRITLNFM
ncbi:uncharacterized protein LOC144110774 [Amblyomma americanum]